MLEHVLRVALNDDFHLVADTSTGAMDVISARMRIADLTGEEISRMKKRGYYLTNKERSHYIGELRRRWEAQNASAPYWFYVLTTLNCNFDCPICYEQGVRGKQELKAEDIGRIFKEIERIQEEKEIPDDRIFIPIFGGEPLYLNDERIIPELLNRIRKNGWKAVIITNGSRVHDYIRTFEEYREAIADFRITLDGPAHIHNLRRPYRGVASAYNQTLLAIRQLLRENHAVKMQTILGKGNIDHLASLAQIVISQGWLEYENYSWRIEGSHDYSRVSGEKDVVSEGKMVHAITLVLEQFPQLDERLKFESFKHLGHFAGSTGILKESRAYSGPKFGFCEPRKGFQYVFSTDGMIFHCPRTIDNPAFLIGEAGKGINEREKELRPDDFLGTDCGACSFSLFCGGGCPVRKKFVPDFKCRENAVKTIREFIDLMRDKFLEKARKGEIVSLNRPWIEIADEK